MTPDPVAGCNEAAAAPSALPSGIYSTLDKNYTAVSWAASPGGDDGTAGVVTRNSTTKMSSIGDGASNTFLCGEKYVSPTATSTVSAMTAITATTRAGRRASTSTPTVGRVRSGQSPTRWTSPTNPGRTPRACTAKCASAARTPSLRHGLLRRLGAVDQLHGRRRGLPPSWATATTFHRSTAGLLNRRVMTGAA